MLNYYYDFIFPGQTSINILSSNGFDFSKLYNYFGNIDVTKTAHDSTHYIVAHPADGFIFTLVSNGGANSFNYDASGNPTGGIVNNIGIFDYSSYGNVAALNGWNFSLTNFVNAVNTHTTATLDTIFFNNANTHFNAVGSEAADNNGNVVGGDTFVASVNNDVFDGRTNANSDSFGGDFFGGDTVDYSHAPGPNGVTVNLSLSGPQPTVGSGAVLAFQYRKPARLQF